MITPIYEREREVWDGRGRGAYSKPAGPIADTPTAALAAIHDQHYGGDVLVCRVRTEKRAGWQAWFRRATARGEQLHQRDYDYECGGGDRRARKHRAGAGRVWVENVN